MNTARLVGASSLLTGDLPAARAPVRVAGIGTATPPMRFSREDVSAALARTWPRLSRRASLLSGPAEGFRFLLRKPDEMATAMPLGEQSAHYAVAATELARSAAERALAEADVARHSIGLLVVASCTGFVLPGVDARLVPGLGLRDDVWRMPLTQLGCAGGAAGLARAVDWTRTHPGERALVVAVEVPSLTFRPGDHSIDNLLSALVFGDGAGALVLESRGGADSHGLHIGRVRSVLVPDSLAALGYDLADDGFRVTLSRRLPQLLAEALPALVGDFRGANTCADLDAVALHPGGTAIVDAVAASLGLRHDQLDATRRVLRSSGNTSSAGILFVLEALAASLPSPVGAGIVLGFGPGLTVELLELAWHC